MVTLKIIWKFVKKYCLNFNEQKLIKFIKCITVKKNIYINVRSETRVIAFQLKNATKKQPLAGATRLPTDAGWRAAPSTGKWWRHSSASWRHCCPATWAGWGPWRCGRASSFGYSPVQARRSPPSYSPPPRRPVDKKHFKYLVCK